MLGGGTGNGRVRIRAIGMVESVSATESTMRIKWLRSGLDHVIPGHGLFASVHGPFQPGDDVFRDVFGEFVTLGLSQRALIDDINAIERASDGSRSTKESLIDARLGQGKFRSDVLRLWDNCCAVTGSSLLEAIRASHIKPWRDSSDEERLDPANGLPLAAHLDALFDAGLITFDDSGAGIVSSLLAGAERRIYGLSNISLKKLPAKTAKSTRMYLQIHRSTVFRK
jgi:hypothetical protein